MLAPMPRQKKKAKSDAEADAGRKADDDAGGLADQAANAMSDLTDGDDEQQGEVPRGERKEKDKNGLRKITNDQWKDSRP